VAGEQIQAVVQIPMNFAGPPGRAPVESAAALLVRLAGTVLFAALTAEKSKGPPLGLGMMLAEQPAKEMVVSAVPWSISVSEKSDACEAWWSAAVAVVAVAAVLVENSDAV
jgi:hypothetical protein